MSFCVITAGALAAAAMVAVGGASATSHSSSGTLRMSATADITMDPPNAPGETDLMVLHSVYQTLVGYDFKKSAVVPQVATRWKASGGGRVYTFYLNRRARFASGNRLTAVDVKYSLDRVVAYTTAAQGYQIAPFLRPDSVKVVDAHTVQIKLAKPAPAFLAALTGTAASILDSKVVKAHGSNGDMGKAWLATHAAGSGPFVLSEWVRNSHIILTRNSRYWGQRPQLNRVVIQYVESEPQAVSLLKGGDLDAASSILPKDVKSLTKAGFTTSGGPDVNVYYLSMNILPDSPFRSVQVRQAVSYAVDYNGLINQLLGGDAVRAGGVINKGLLGYHPALNTKFKTDLEKARSLLAKGGYPDGFKTELYYQNDSPVLGVSADTLAAKLQFDLARVGIDVTLRGQPSATVFPQYRAGELPFVFWYFSPTYPDPDVIMSPHGDANTQATTRVHYNDKTVTNLILRARVTPDPAVRKRLYFRAQELVASRGPYTFLFRPLRLYVVRKGATLPYIPIWSVDLARASAN